MLHLFNKVYLEFDEKIEINYDRVVISEVFGNQMAAELDKLAYGELIAYGKSFSEVIDNNNGFVEFITKLKEFGETSSKKIIIYCDKEAYKLMMTKWLKSVMPSLTLDAFKTLVDHTMYNQRVVSNTQLSSVYSINLKAIWEGLDDIEQAFNETESLSPNDIDKLKQLSLNLSYEFLMANYLSGDNSYKQQLKSTMHLFMRRWFKEMFTDNRQMVLLNITNHNFQKTFNIDPELVDITRVDPLAGIPGFEYYADDEIWERNSEFATGIFGTCNLENLSTEQIDGLKNTILNVYGKFEGMQIDTSIFNVLNWVNIAASNEITDDQLEEIVDYIVATPFDTNLIPRFDFQNVNFPLFLYFLDQKNSQKDLTSYRLL